ncbi:hypothetical protein HEP81_08130 (plasmid) [Streptomyces griseofuscus]|uniref:Uncharacterized protein n=1 Tax=Streptomyces griseofuscus TaxID=146922 RepID=A0A7H1QDH8_9ACTN|nr:DUF6233 domain-containing protein [Streptomyces griseofuscus]QNT98358.1 hypothetical protein HEP81_08130 [Streptomyces griseofuscus]
MQQATASLRQIDGWIAEEERREAARRRTAEREQPPEWLVQFRHDGATIDSVHSGGCWAVPKWARCRPVIRAQAVEALQNHVSACPACRPDTVLGFPG